MPCTLALAALLAALSSAPAALATERIPKPQAFIVVNWARIVPPEGVSPDMRERLVAVEAAIRKAQDDHMRQFDAWMAQLDADPLSASPEPRLDLSAARALAEETLRSLGPQDPGLPVALYLSGWIAREEQRDADAIAAFEAITDRFPKSVHAPEASYRVGELRLERGELAAAQQAFEQAIGPRGSHFHALALFQAAWTAVRAGRGDAAWDLFARLVTHIDAAPDDPHAGALRPDAIAFLSLILLEPDGDPGGPVIPGTVWDRIVRRLDGSRPFHAEVADRTARTLRELDHKPLAKRVEAHAQALREREKRQDAPQ